ncbi:hypothetical protein AABD40_12885 [Staphylococcus shinii]|uniref:hypothetical protein n=1 Tax=Staphylococcus shinii TaxID=2912228 RepID=UPI00298F04C5|nr:hypothetical protein [Staphylococcus shinii]MDW8570470.1 hypothetical protein [Staphylococcus shinii]MDW8573625.1 hypothetical protein [Staphylococcus shinii]
MQILTYEFIVLDFNNNEELYRFEADTREKVENKLESIKDDNGVQYKVLTLGSVGFVGEIFDTPNDAAAKVEVLKLSLPKN